MASPFGPTSIVPRAASKSGMKEYNDDEYLEYIKQYEGTEFYEQLLNNPFLISKNAEFVPSYGQAFAQAFGDYSARNNYYGNLINQRNQYLEQQLEAMRQQQHDLPQNEVARQRLAGLNPDLNGGSSIGTGQAAENDQPMMPGPFPDSSEGPGPMETFGKIGNFVLQAVTFGQSFASNMQQLGLGEIEQTDKLSKVVGDFLGDYSDLFSFDENSHSWQSRTLDYNKLNNFADNNFRSRRLKKAFLKSVEDRYTSAKAYLERNKTASGALREFISLGQTAGELKGYGSDGYQLEPIIEVSNVLNEASIKISKLQKQFDTAYWHEMNRIDENGETGGTQVARTERSELSSRRQSAESSKIKASIDAVIDGALEQIVMYLEKSAKEGGWTGAWSSGALLMFSALRSGLVPSIPAPTFNIDRSSKNFIKLPGQ